MLPSVAASITQVRQKAAAANCRTLQTSVIGAARGLRKSKPLQHDTTSVTQNGKKSSSSAPSGSAHDARTVQSPVAIEDNEHDDAEDRCAA